MNKPKILTVDDDPVVSAAISRDLRSRHGSEYRIVRATSGAQALAALTKLALRAQPVALIATDQRMPEMTGIEMLERARADAPDVGTLAAGLAHEINNPAVCSHAFRRGPGGRMRHAPVVVAPAR